MHRNPVWIGLLILVAVLELWFSWKALSLLVDYLGLKQRADAYITEWSIEERSKNEYVLHAKYYFFVEGRKHEGESSLGNHLFRNAWIAGDALDKVAKQKWSIWYNPSTLETQIHKEFPLKQVLYASMLSLLLVYFIWLGCRIGKVGNKTA